MKSILLLMMAIFTFSILYAQNVGIGTTSPLYRLDVNGDIRASAQVLAGAVSTTTVSTTNLYVNSGGTPYDFLMKDPSGKVGFRKGHGGVGLNYIIAVRGTVSNNTGADQYNVTFVGEIKLYAGNNNIPAGWVPCEGQLLPIASPLYSDLFNVIGTTYGGNGVSTFNLPDLRGAVPVMRGTSSAGYNWSWGETTN